MSECTCHPDDNPPKPCPQRFAYSECVQAAHREQEPTPAEAIKTLQVQVLRAMLPFNEWLILLLLRHRWIGYLLLAVVSLACTLAIWVLLMR